MRSRYPPTGDLGLLTFVESYVGEVDTTGGAAAVSPDGDNVYVPSGYIARYARDATVGKLTLAERITDEREP